MSDTITDIDDLRGMLPTEILAVILYQRARAEAAEARIAALEAAPIREALARVIGAFTSGVYCANCGDSVDDCDCIIGEARAALAPETEER